ncbi:hypothetical protein [Botrimarina hoheduenensis]|uniref:PEP-CTERM protein-sorting domain-containing protein n=1 Tax=Botrimarina hoheduenensis TaxID=2528000 RepID=A0A5C5VTA6_9BACT|nr:hypothetical protein [Botrimarina hoheduenensis]TWT41333.1 hypothetical protein Pla111_30470 [Botrimarina hoheduenensis]
MTYPKLVWLAPTLLLVLAAPSHGVETPLGSAWMLNEGAGPGGENTAQLSGNSADGYSFLGEGTTGNQPGTTNPDTRTRAKVFNDFSTVDLSAVGSTLTMSYDILWMGTERPSNESQDWRFGFVSMSGNGGRGVTLGANFDIGNLAGTTYYEFFADPEVNPTSTDSGVPAGDMDFAFTGTNNSGNIPDFATDQARIAQSQNDPFNLGLGPFDGDYNDDQTVDAADYTVWRDNNPSSETLPNDPSPGTVDGSDYTTWVNNFGQRDTEDIVAFNDTTDTHRVTLTLTRINDGVADGYDLEMTWTNLDQIVDGVNPTITHTATIKENDSFTDGDPLAAAARVAAVTEWDRLGFFINADLNRSPTPDEPWQYVISNASVETTGVISSTGSAVPEPTAAVITIGVLGAVGGCRRPRR